MPFGWDLRYVKAGGEGWINGIDAWWEMLERTYGEPFYWGA